MTRPLTRTRRFARPSYVPVGWLVGWLVGLKFNPQTQVAIYPFPRITCMLLMILSQVGSKFENP